MSKKFAPWLILHDIHIPWHDEKLLRKVFQMATDYQFEGVVLGGDALDMFSVSRHNQGSLGKLRDMRLEDEYKVGRRVFADLINAVGRKCTERHYIAGNHECFIDKWFADSDNAKVEGCVERPEEALRVRENGFVWYPNWMDDYVQLGEHCQVIHGTSVAMNCAKVNLETFEQSTISGHAHRSQSYFSGKRCSISNGYLGDGESAGFKYMPRQQRARWMPGFCVVNVFPDGTFHPIPVSCHGRKFIFNGKLY